jgi:energy-coupling factor transport system ATP-binding protein
VLEATVRLRDGGRPVVISEHRFDTLAIHADAVIAVEHGRCRHGSIPDHKPAVTTRPTTAGGEAWSLSSVTAGFDGHAVVAAVDLAGRHGEVVALTGPNGAGKTTLLRTIAGTLAPLSGKVERRPGRVAYLPQNPAALLFRPTVRAEVELTLRRAADREHGDDPNPILEELHLTHVADRYPRDLSTGERQRAALAAVLAGRPSCVLLDEPTRGMDVAARDALIKLITRLRGEGSAVVIATHDAALREAVADRVVDVCGGKVAA